MDIEFENVEDIPEREYAFQLKQETKEMMALLAGMKPGETIKFPVSQLEGHKETKRKQSLILSRLQSASKHTEGWFIVKSRGYDVYVKRES